MARASSGSRSCSSSVEPLMSANSAVTVLRSPSSVVLSTTSEVIRIRGFSGTLGRGADELIGVAHREQKRALAIFSAPHFVHTAASGVAHRLQNFDLNEFSLAHLGQRI